MKRNETQGISRRDFLKGAAAGAVSVAAMGVLGGCSSSAAETQATTDAAPETTATTDAPVETTAAPETVAATAAPASESGALTAAKSLEKWEFEIAPDPIPEDQITETIEDEIIIVGSGMSGLTTAFSAQQSGASVTLFSGSSGPISRGGSNFAANSKVMESFGIEKFDPTQFFYNEMRAASFQVDQRKWMRGYNNSEEAMNWLIDLVEEDGLKVVLERDNVKDKGPYYAHAFNTEGNDAMVSTGQQGAVESMARHAEAAGATIIYDTVAEQLIREDNNTGRVTGVVARKADGSYVKFVGTKAVVLATGDFSANKQMVAKYCPMVLDLIGLEEAETDYNTAFSLSGIYKGDGQRMGLWIGAAWQHAYPNAPMMQGAWGGSHEPCGFHHGLNVNTRTERYQREDISSPYSSNHLLAQPGNVAYGIWTANYAQDLIDRGHEWYLFGSDYTKPAKTAAEMIELWEGSGYVKADTLEELAEQLELDPEKLKAVVARYNELCEKGVDEDFYKNPDYLIPIKEEGPFYAAKNTATFMTVMGGLRTNSDLQVCDENDDPIPGLFNVGAMIGDMYANTYNFAIPGNSYGINCLTFGYLLGRDLAAGKFDA